MCDLLEYITTGWPNHPGRPELVSNNRFAIEVKLYQPDYLGGLTADDGLQYHVYVAYAGDTYMDEDLYTVIDASNTSTITNIDLTEDTLITGLNTLWNKYHIAVRIITKNRELIEVAALPKKSPPLHIDTLCDLVG